MIGHKLAVVSGASSGIGEAIASRLLILGFSVIGISRSIQSNHFNNENFKAIQVDLSNQKETLTLCETLKKESTFILVNAAGVIKTGSIENTSLSDWDRMMNINLRAVFYLMKLAAPHLIKSKGVIVNVSSVNGIRSFPGVLAYNVNRLFVLSTLDKSWHRHQVQTLRCKLYGAAGKIVFHGRYVYLKVSRSLQKLFAQVRLRSWDFART